MAIKYKIFVYGTLKKREPNHFYLQDSNGNVNYLGKAKTREKYPLIIANSCNVPMILHKPGLGQQIEGEVYEVDASIVLDLDILQDHPIFYTRSVYDVKYLNGFDDQVWIYTVRNFRQELLELPFYKCYNSQELGLKYVDGQFINYEEILDQRLS